MKNQTMTQDQELTKSEDVELKDAFIPMNIFKVITIINANKHFARTKGATIIDPVKLDDGSWQIVFRGMNKLGEIGAKEIIISPEDMEIITENELYKMMSDALEEIIKFKEESKNLISLTSNELIK